MANFSGTIMTNEGKKLLAKGMQGEKIEFTKMLIGDGYVPSGTKQSTMKNVVSVKKTLPLVKVEVIGDGTVRARGIYTNKGMSTGFYVREIGLFAKGVDGVEIMYCYTNAGDTADYIPGEGDNIIENVLDIITIIDQAENVTAVISDSIEYITRKDIATATEVEMGGTDKVVTVDALHDYVDNFAWPLNQVNSRYSADTDNARYTISWDAGGENNLLVPYSHNKVVMKEAGKFIYSNTTYGGTRGELNQVTIDLIEKIYSINKRDKRYGTEFFITKTTQGDGETAPLSVAENTNTYYRTYMGEKNRSTPYSRVFWIKAEEANTVVVISRGKTYIDGERITKHTVLQDTDWHFIICNHTPPNGNETDNLVYMMKGKSCYTALEYVGASYLPPTAVLGAPTLSIFDYNGQNKVIFKIGGDPGHYYPVLFQMPYGKLKIYRKSVHEDEILRGNIYLEIEGRTSGWGNTVEMLDYKYSGRNDMAKEFYTNSISCEIVVYLKGDSTYWFEGYNSYLQVRNDEGKMIKGRAVEYYPVARGEDTQVIPVVDGSAEEYEGRPKKRELIENTSGIKNIATSIGGLKLDNNGYIKYDNGLIFQWGYASSSIAGKQVILPIAFEGDYNVFFSRNSGSSSIVHTTFASSQKTMSSFIVHNNHSDTTGVRWFAIGY